MGRQQSKDKERYHGGGGRVAPGLVRAVVVLVGSWSGQQGHKKVCVDEVRRGTWDLGGGSWVLWCCVCVIFHKEKTKC